MLYMNLVNKLNAYRLDKKISQKELAKRLDVAFATVNRWFNSRYEPNEINIHHIEKLLKRK